MTVPTVCWAEGTEFILRAGAAVQVQLDWTDWLAEFADDAPIVSAVVTAEGQVAAVQIGLTAYAVSIELTAPESATKGMRTTVTCKIVTEGQCDVRPFQVMVC